jgi:hypothetical protein
VHPLRARLIELAEVPTCSQRRRLSELLFEFALGNVQWLVAEIVFPFGN